MNKMCSRVVSLAPCRVHPEAHTQCCASRTGPAWSSLAAVEESCTLSSPLSNTWRVCCATASIWGSRKVKRSIFGAKKRCRKRRLGTRSVACAASTSLDANPEWHCAQSSAADTHTAVQEVLAKWQAATGLQRVSDAQRPVLVCDREPPVPFSVVDKIWHNWRAGTYGDVTLADAVRAQATEHAGLKEAFELFPDRGADVLFPEWRISLRWERPWKSKPQEIWKAAMMRGFVAGELRRASTDLREERMRTMEKPIISPMLTSKGLTAGFAMVLVPVAWAGQLDAICREIEAALGWPDESPFVGVATDGKTLTLGTAFLPPVRALPPKVFFMGPEEFEEAGGEGFRVQEALDEGNMYYTKYWREHGRTNGTVVACRHMYERTVEEVKSIIVFADPAASANFPCQALGLLDSSFPKAIKAGMIAAASDEYPGRSLYLGGSHGGLKQRGLLGVLLPGPADSAAGLCGCEAVGPLWEVFDADASVGASIIKTVADPDSAERDDDGRRIGLPAGKVMTELVGEDDVWVGVPRVEKRRARQEAPGVGEWALYKSRAALELGGLLLEGPGPGAEGVGGSGRLKLKPITRAQCFKTLPDHMLLGRMYTSYKMDKLAEIDVSDDGTMPKPYATLVFGGGPGAKLSILDEGLFGGVCLGSAVIASPGNVLHEKEKDDEKEEERLEENLQPQAPTLMHRQAAALLVLYS